MSQTAATKAALERDEFFCRICLEIHHRVRHIFDDRVWDYHPAYAGGHHVFGRSRVDTADTIMAVCAECHHKIEHAKIPKIVVVAVMSKVAGRDLFRQYREFCRWDDAAWERVYNEGHLQAQLVG